jgi:hypothetical protein
MTNYNNMNLEDLSALVVDINMDMMYYAHHPVHNDEKKVDSLDKELTKVKDRIELLEREGEIFPKRRTIPILIHNTTIKEINMERNFGEATNDYSIGWAWLPTRVKTHCTGIWHYKWIWLEHYRYNYVYYTQSNHTAIDKYVHIYN